MNFFKNRLAKQFPDIFYLTEGNLNMDDFNEIIDSDDSNDWELDDDWYEEDDYEEDESFFDEEG